MEIIIKPKTKWWHLDFKELWRFSDLFYFFAWRDIKVKYKQTLIGIAWAVLQPFVTMVIFSIIFGYLAKVPSEGIPYPVFVYSGLLFWLLFSNGLTEASGSFIGNERIITKVYFPKIILPLSSIITNLADFFIAAIILAGLMIYYGFAPNLIGLLLLPILVLLTVLSAASIGLLLGSLNVKYRDVRFALPFFLQLLIFVTPVIYPVSIVSEKYRWLLGLNPMSGIIDSARAILLNTKAIDWPLLGISVLSLLVYGCIGYIYFKKVERYFADII